MKCVCMFLSASGDVEVGLRGPRELGEPTRSASEKVRFSKITGGESFFFLLTFVIDRQTLCRIVFSESKLFPPALFFFCHHSARQSERRTARTVGALPSAWICFGRCE